MSRPSSSGKMNAEALRAKTPAMEGKAFLVLTPGASVRVLAILRSHPKTDLDDPQPIGGSGLAGSLLRLPRRFQVRR